MNHKPCKTMDSNQAILDRVDVSLYIGLPAVDERRLMVRLYMDMHLLNIAKRSQSRWWPFTRRYVVDQECSSNTTTDLISHRCNGFSGREIAKMFIACRYALVMAEQGKLSMDVLLETVDYKVQEHRMKRSFQVTVSSSSTADENDSA